MFAIIVTTTATTATVTAEELIATALVIAIRIMTRAKMCC